MNDFYEELRGLVNRYLDEVRVGDIWQWEWNGISRPVKIMSQCPTNKDMFTVSYPENEEVCFGTIRDCFNFKIGGETMKSWIITLFPKTEDAVLVENEVGGMIADNRLAAIILAGKEKDVLALALEIKSARESKS